MGLSRFIANEFSVDRRPNARVEHVMIDDCSGCRSVELDALLESGGRHRHSRPINPPLGGTERLGA